MIEVLAESSGNVLAVKASAKLTDADYKDTFIPRLEEVIAEHGKARLLFTFDESFEGWEPRAMWDDASWGIRHLNDFEKIAMVGAKKWVEWAVKLDAHFMKGTIRTFDRDQLDSAREWIKE